MAICIEGFSTFACKSLINIHDMITLPSYRRKGICTSLLSAIETYAKDNDCCKITLEVLSNNQVAKAAYNKV